IAHGTAIPGDEPMRRSAATTSDHHHVVAASGKRARKHLADLAAAAREHDLHADIGARRHDSVNDCLPVARRVCENPAMERVCGLTVEQYAGVTAALAEGLA